jgi:hypothetical protein
MSIKRGPPTHNRTRARNFIQREAQKRLDETIKPFLNQIDNSLHVDAVPIFYYSTVPTGTPCTCEESPITEAFTENPGNAPTVARQGGTNVFRERSGGIETIKILPRDYEVPLFGTPGETATAKDMAEDDDDGFALDLDDPVPRTSSNLFAGRNVDCGICYGIGYVPGFSLLQSQRLVLTTHDIEDANGFFIDNSTAPHTIERQHQSGYVDFLIRVPKYFKRVRFSVRKNRELLAAAKLYDEIGNVINLAKIRDRAGKSLIVRVSEPEFTHVILEFDLGLEPIVANVAGISRTLDYTMLETIGNLQVILPTTPIGKVASGDVIAVPFRNLFLKVSDVDESLQTAMMTKFEWRANCRILQPQEALRNLHKALPLQ